MKKRTVAAALLFTMVMTTSLSTVSGAENVTIKFLHKYCQPEQAPVFEEIVKQYEEAHPGVHIEIETTTDNEIKSKLKLALGSGDMPDVYQTWTGEYCEKFIRAGYALDLTPYLEADSEWKDSFIPAAYSAFTYEDGQYAVPTRFDAEVFIYKKSVFEKYGFEEPKTWDDLMQICETLKADGVTPFILGDGLSWDAPH